MNDQLFIQLILAGQEDRNREFKQSFPWDKRTNGSTVIRVVKTILAMGNLQDGGHIIIGVNEPDPSKGIGYEPAGIQEEHLRTYSHDKITDLVHEFADPMPIVEFRIIPHENKKFAIISVMGFNEFPIICRKSYESLLSQGSVYYRPRSGRPRSETITNYSDTRELLTLAVEKGIVKYLQQQSRIRMSDVDDKEQFENQLGDFS